MSRAEILLLAGLAFLAGVLSVDRGDRGVIEEATTRSIMPATTADFAPDPKGGAPLAIPNQNALRVPCPVTTRSVPPIRKSVA